MAKDKKSVVFLFPPVDHRLDTRDDVFDLLKAKGYRPVCYRFYRADSEQECIDEAQKIIDDYKPILVAVPDIMVSDQWIKDKIEDWEGGLIKLVNYIEKKRIPIYWIKLSEIGFGGPFDDELVVYGNREKFVKRLLSHQKAPV